ncbi:MAG TPA: cation diffusion facilitator family transporter [Candidatus Lumbricidophila sp.]|nr:cation diffusion facilitator family transporter [Candidatus Lumbricidophila sp.]
MAPHDHQHAAHGHGHAHGASDRRRLAAAIAIIAAATIAQFVGSLVTGSIALLADSGHLLSDLLGLVVALGAARVAARPATDRHTYGFRRFEVFGALFNGVAVLGVAVFVAIGAVIRLIQGARGESGDVLAEGMLVVAIAGLVANVAALIVLHQRRAGEPASINVRGASLEVLSDTIGSAVVIAAALIILGAGWRLADPIASLVIAAMIVPRAVSLLREVARVLSESTPRSTDIALIRQHLTEASGVVEVHDVHVWQITTGQAVFTAHVGVEPSVFTEGRAAALLDELDACLSAHFDVAHSTLQLEPAGRADPERSAHS